MKRTFCILFLFTGVWFQFSLYCQDLLQNKVININPIAHTTTSTLPYDQSFLLKIPLTEDQNIQEIYFKEQARKKRKQTLVTERDTVKNWFVSGSGKNKVVYARIPALPPNRFYDFFIIKSFYGRPLNFLMNINNLLYSKQPDKARELFGKINITDTIIGAFHFPSFQEYLLFYEKQLAPLYEYTNDSIVPQKEINLLMGFNGISLNQLLISAEKDEKEELIRPVEKIFNITAPKASEVLLGRIPLNYDQFAQPAALYDVKSRLDNFQQTVQTLNQLYDFAGVVKLKNLKDTLLVQRMDTFRYQVNEAVEQIKTNQTYIEQIVNKIRNNRQLFLVYQVKSTTEESNFNIRSKQVLTPDVGFAVINSFPDIDLFGAQLPYFGVNINLRPVNKNIRLKYIKNKSTLHYLSIMCGITVGSIEKENKRDDLFGSSNFLLGVSCRLGHLVRFSIGTFMYNTLEESSIDVNFFDQRIAFAPFAGISIDLKLINLLGNAGNIVGL